MIKGKQWDQLRLRVLFEEPACYLCGRPSTQVDHVEPLTLRPDLAFERSNLRGICASCNSRKSDRVDGKHYLPETATPRRGVEL